MLLALPQLQLNVSAQDGRLDNALDLLGSGSAATGTTSTDTSLYKSATGAMEDVDAFAGLNDAAEATGGGSTGLEGAPTGGSTGSALPPPPFTLPSLSPTREKFSPSILVDGNRHG